MECHWEAGFYNAILLPNLYAAWTRYAPFNVARVLLKLQIAAKEQSSDGQLFSLDIEKVRLSNNRCVQTSFVVSEQSVFQVPSFVRCDHFGIESCLKVLLDDFLARWLFDTQTLTTHLSIIGVEELCNATLRDDTDEVLDSGNLFRHVITCGLGLATDVKDLRVLKIEGAVATWGQL